MGKNSKSEVRNSNQIPNSNLKGKLGQSLPVLKQLRYRVQQNASLASCGIELGTWKFEFVSNFEPRISNLSVLLLALIRGPREFGHFGHFEANLFLDDFREGDVGRAHVPGFDEGAAHGTGAGVELTDAARD